jgi:hypothetical protein
MTQHRELSVERWSGFTLDQQILMIANEMNRASSLLRSQVQTKSTLRWELLRWRGLLEPTSIDRLSDVFFTSRRRPRNKFRI